MSVWTVTAVPPERAGELAELAGETFIETYADQIAPDLLVPYTWDVFVPEVTVGLVAEGARALWVCEHTRPVAYMTLQMPRGPDDPPTVRLGRLYVRSSHHGRGLGRRLMDEAVSLGKVAQLRTLELTVWENNTAAIAFYEHVGFRACGEVPFKMGDDVQRDIVMCLPL